MRDARVCSPGARPALHLSKRNREEYGVRYRSPTDNSPGELYMEWGKLLHTEYGEHAIGVLVRSREHMNGRRAASLLLYCVSRGVRIRDTALVPDG